MLAWVGYWHRYMVLMLQFTTWVVHGLELVYRSPKPGVL